MKKRSEGRKILLKAVQIIKREKKMHKFTSVFKLGFGRI